MTKERFVEILVECGYAQVHAEGLWATQPASAANNRYSVVNDENRLREFGRSALRNPLFQKFRKTQHSDA